MVDFDRPGILFLADFTPDPGPIEVPESIQSANFDKYVPYDFGMPNKDLNWKLAQFLEKNILTNLALNESQMDCMAEMLDWSVISKRTLSGPFYVKHKNLIDWKIFLQCNRPDDVKSLKEVYDKLVENQYLFFNQTMKKKYYTIEFISAFPNLIDWKWAAKNVKFDDTSLLKLWGYFKITDLSRYQHITEKIAKEKLEIIDWNLASNRRLSDGVIDTAHKFINWKKLCRKKKLLSEQMLLKYAKYIDWQAASKYQDLSAFVIRKFHRRLNMKHISLHQNLPLDLIKELEPSLDFTLLSKNNHYNKSGKLRIIIQKEEVYVLDLADNKQHRVTDKSQNSSVIARPCVYYLDNAE